VFLWERCSHVGNGYCDHDGRYFLHENNFMFGQLAHILTSGVQALNSELTFLSQI
jgi:hypothetical protein